MTGSDRKGSSISSMPTPTERFGPQGTQLNIHSTLAKEKTSDFSFDRYSRSCPGNSNMSLALSQHARAAVRRNQLLSRSMLSLVRQRGPIRWVSAVPGQKPGSDQYVPFILEEQHRPYMLMASLQCPLSRGSQQQVHGRDELPKGLRKRCDADLPHYGC